MQSHRLHRAVGTNTYPPPWRRPTPGSPGNPFSDTPTPGKGKKNPVSDGRTLGLTAEAPAGGDRSLQAVPAASLPGLLGVEAAPRTRWCQFVRAPAPWDVPFALPLSLSNSSQPLSLCLPLLSLLGY